MTHKTFHILSETAKNSHKFGTFKETYRRISYICNIVRFTWLWCGGFAIYEIVVVSDAIHTTALKLEKNKNGRLQPTCM